VLSKLLVLAVVLTLAVVPVEVAELAAGPAVEHLATAHLTDDLYDDDLPVRVSPNTSRPDRLFRLYIL
jgi:hypothetical protein